MNVIENVCKRVGKEFGVDFQLFQYEVWGGCILWRFISSLGNVLEIEYDDSANRLYVKYPYKNIALRIIRELRNTFIFKGLRV